MVRTTRECLKQTKFLNTKIKSKLKCDVQHKDRGNVVAWVQGSNTKAEKTLKETWS